VAEGGANQGFRDEGIRVAKYAWKALTRMAVIRSEMTAAHAGGKGYLVFPYSIMVLNLIILTVAFAWPGPDT
jgi:hypothetical protein